MSTETQELPEVGEIVIATIKKLVIMVPMFHSMNMIIFKDSYTYQKLLLVGLEKLQNMLRREIKKFCW